MTHDQLLQIAGVVAACGVALLLVERDVRLRALAVALIAGGLVPLGASQGPSLSHAVTHRPVLVAAAVAAAVGLGVLGVAVALRWPWLVPVAGVVAALRFPLANPIRPVHYLVPLYLILGCGLAAMLWRSVRGGERPPSLGSIGWLLGAYEIVVAASLFWTLNLDRGVFEMVATYIPLGILASLIARVALTRPFLATLPRVQVSVAFVLAVVATYEWFAERTIVENEKLDVSNAYSGMFRVNSLLYDPSLFGRVEVLALLTVVCVVLLGRPGWRTLAVALVAPVLFCGLLFTFSQTSFAALAAGLVTIAAIAWRRLFALLLLAGVLAITVGVALSQPQVMKVLNTSLDKASSSRVGLATRGVRTFREHPVHGVGLGGFGIATGVTEEEKARVAPHNVVVDVASELGILGLAVFGSTLAAVILAIRRVDRPLLRLILAAELVALVVHGLAYDQFFSDPTWWTIAVLAAVGATVPRPAGHDVLQTPEPIGATP